jgi:hypothetical protein
VHLLLPCLAPGWAGGVAHGQCMPKAVLMWDHHMHGPTRGLAPWSVVKASHRHACRNKVQNTRQDYQQASHGQLQSSHVAES